jgi:hypothetical protein
MLGEGDAEFTQVVLQSVDQNLIALPGQDRNAPTEPLRVEDSHQGAEAVGVAIVGSRGEEEFMLELGREFFDTSRELRGDRMGSRRGRGSVMGLVQDQQRARADKTTAQPGAQVRGVFLVLDQVVGDEEPIVGRPWIDVEAPLFSDAVNVGAVDDLEQQAKSTFHLLPPLLAAIRALAALATPDGTAVLVLRNVHRLLGSAEIVQALEARITAGKRDRTVVVVLAPVIQIPVELERHFAVLEHELPDRDDLHTIARGVATEAGELPEGVALEAVLDASSGLTRTEAENSVSLALLLHGKLTPEVLWELNGQALQQAGLLALHRGGESFADMGGLSAFKSFCARVLRPGRPAGVRPRGVLLDVVLG